MATKSRRAFLKLAGAGALGLSVSNKAHALSPSEKVVVGLIGCGGRGSRFLEYADFVCDPDAERLAAQHGSGAHAQYNALRRRIVSFQHALACAR